MANGGVALGGEGHDDPAGAGAVHLPHHEVDLAQGVAQPPWVALPVVAVQRHWDRQQLKDVWDGRGRDRHETDGQTGGRADGRTDGP